MTRLIFDIETVGVDFDSLEPKSQEYFLRFADSPEKEEEARRSLSFYPQTGHIVAIGILNPDTDRGAVFYQSPEGGEKTEDATAQYVPFGNERDLLTEFWEVARHYDQFITFNGRTFDNPYIMVRSAITKVKPTKNLMPNRYYDSHIDLLDRLTFFGAVQRKMSLHMWCQAFGIKSPKADGITGDDVAGLFKAKKYLDIATYCFGDIRATKELFEYWDRYINIK